MTAGLSGWAAAYALRKSGMGAQSSRSDERGRHRTSTVTRSEARIAETRRSSGRTSVSGHSTLRSGAAREPRSGAHARSPRRSSRGSPRGTSGVSRSRTTARHRRRAPPALRATPPAPRRCGTGRSVRRRGRGAPTTASAPRTACSEGSKSGGEPATTRRTRSRSQVSTAAARSTPDTWSAFSTMASRPLIHVRKRPRAPAVPSSVSSGDR